MIQTMADSIFENPASSNPPLSHQTPLSRNERNRKAAINHAKLLQDRKDTEMEIFECLELLIDYPISMNSDAAHPSAEDITEVKRMLIPFQPSDYDALIEERNINRKCGYVLCPKQNKLQGTNAKYGFLHTKDSGTRIVDRKLLERWCSSECGQRALYLRVQLSEEPAWERVGGVGGHFVLLDEKHQPAAQIDASSQLLECMEKLSLRNDEEKIIAALKELSIERGDGHARRNSKSLASVQVAESSQTNVQSNQLQTDSAQHFVVSHNQIEGYQPKGLQGRIPS